MPCTYINHLNIVCLCLSHVTRRGAWRGDLQTCIIVIVILGIKRAPPTYSSFCVSAKSYCLIACHNNPHLLLFTFVPLAQTQNFLLSSSATVPFPFLRKSFMIPTLLLLMTNTQALPVSSTNLKECISQTHLFALSLR